MVVGLMREAGNSSRRSQESTHWDLIALTLHPQANLPRCRARVILLLLALFLGLGMRDTWVSPTDEASLTQEVALFA